MFSSVNAVETGLTPSNSAAAGAAPSSNVDFQNFLRLLTAQLRNQDPLSPSDPTEFVSQLAGFSTVEQLVQSNAKLDDIGRKISGTDLASLGGMIGKIAESDAPSTRIDAPVSYRIPYDPSFETVDLVVRDAVGAEIARTRAQNTGAIQEWGGLNPPISQNGPFFLFADYQINGETLKSARASTFSAITSVRLDGNKVAVGLVNGSEISLDAITGLSG